MMANETHGPVHNSCRKHSALQWNPRAERLRYRSGHRTDVDARRTVRESACRSRVPIQAKGSIDRDEHIPDALCVINDYYATDVCRSPHESLTHPHDLDTSSDVDRPVARAVLTRYLSDTGIDSERLESLHHDRGDEVESLSNPGSRLGIGHRPGEGDRASVEHRGSSTGKALHCFKTMCSGGADCESVSLGDTVRQTERHDRFRHIEPEDAAELAVRHRRQYRMANSSVHGARLGKLLVNKCVVIHDYAG